MKLSRRGKSARQGRHTKRARKNLRYKGKKVHGSKRYHRGIGDRGHTKKTHRKNTPMIFNATAKMSLFVTATSFFKIP